MVAAHFSKPVALALIVTTALAGTPSKADPVDWASAGGDLFVATSSPGRDFIMDPKSLEPFRSIVAPQRRPRPEPLPPRPANEPLPAPQIHVAPEPEDYGEVHLLPSNQPLDALIQKIAVETGLDPKLLHALVIIESAYNTRAVSPVGARGITQLMPGTARELGVTNVYDTEQNLRAGARYLAIQIGRFSDIRLALAAYNSGPNRVARLGRVPDITETQGYVRDGVDCYLALTAGRGIRNRSQCRTSRGR
jgi:hypothetical protein